MTDIQDKLNESIPPHFISERSGLSYVTGAYVKNRLNEVFGWDGWSFEVVEERVVSITDEAVRWFAHVALRVQDKTPREDKAVWSSTTVIKNGIAVGHGNLIDKYGKPFSVGRQSEVIDFAAAEAVTDALKRAAVSLGNSMGLQLYPMSSGAPEPEKDVIAEIPVVKDFANAICETSALDVLQVVGEAIKEAGLSASSLGGLHELYVKRKKELEG